ncbi:hypothetical protein PPTG_23951 [Phytophthora nicotianae INRA-310]|uniref:Uncharacterized protein n=1 Tax=Phytophthora nicotianae (strain INRA-310) TaxID=761204 RepID=W2PPI2_PHYN3|nr:hypothetical protein PPTG_23951 [Phytophthora nicotianae INRA-310]ETN02174.1 hypothetical protein PPTG_23951 [Phytophthora nicotianae INRA-310]
MDLLVEILQNGTGELLENAVFVVSCIAGCGRRYSSAIGVGPLLKHARKVIKQEGGIKVLKALSRRGTSYQKRTAAETLSILDRSCHPMKKRARHGKTRKSYAQWKSSRKLFVATVNFTNRHYYFLVVSIMAIAAQYALHDL